MKWECEKEKLNQLVNIENYTYDEIGKIYGCSGSNIRKVCSKLKITLPKRRKINNKETFNKGKVKTFTCINCGKQFKPWSTVKALYCSSQCCNKYNHRMKYQRILEGDESIMRSDYSPRTFKDDITREQGSKCAICGCEQIHNEKPLVFVLDHIDGNAANNKRDNLRCICPNCDSQLPTYKSKNKNSARYYYRYGRHKDEK